MRALALSAALLFAGCSEYDLSQHPPAVESAPPDIEVDPGQLTFGALADGETEIQKFEIFSRGEAPLTISGISIVSGISFTLATPVLEVVLDPGQSKTVEVEFQPFQGGQNFGQVVVFSDDPDSPEVPVDLLGKGQVPELKITPETWDFGQTLIPCGDQLQVVFENVGAEPLVIDDFDYASSGLLAFSHALTLPLTLAPGETAAATVTFDAATVATDFGQLDVFSSDPRGVVSADQTGAGAYAGSNHDQHVVPTNPPVDILFAVDQSCSMDTEAAALGAAFSNFIGTIDTVTSGWQIGVVTHDHGCFNSGVLTSSTPNYNGLFQAAVVDGGHEVWSEALLALSDIALGQTAGCNAGFLRPGAMLHVIIVSDEPEQSGTNWSTWVNDLSLWAPPGLFKVSAVVDLGGCGSGPAGYTEAAMATGGEILNICNANWASQVGLLATASLSGLNTFALSDTPDPGTIEVRVDGSLWTTGWVYDPASNSVVFDDPQFDGGEVIDIAYSVLSGC